SFPQDPAWRRRSSVMQVVSSSSARARLTAARLFVNRFPPDTELLIVGATRGAADDFARAIARTRATFGLHRFSLTELAARAAAGGRDRGSCLAVSFRGGCVEHRALARLSCRHARRAV